MTARSFEDSIQSISARQKFRHEVGDLQIVQIRKRKCVSVNSDSEMNHGDVATVRFTASPQTRHGAVLANHRPGWESVLSDAVTVEMTIESEEF